MIPNATEGIVMKNKNALLRLALASFLPLLLTLAACDSFDGDKAPPPEVEQVEQASFRIDCFMEDGSPDPVFAASGAIQDKGTVSGDSPPWTQDGNGPREWSGLRTFHGEVGDLTVYIEAESDNHGSKLASGDFVLVAASREYADVQAEGDFELVLNGDLPAEVFQGVMSKTR
jgi:hypothetical protein